MSPALPRDAPPAFATDRATAAYYEQRAAEYDEWYTGGGLFAGRDRPGWDGEVAAVAAVVDTARRPGTHPEQWQPRVLNDGSAHRVYKRFLTADQLAEERGGRPLLDGAWFVVAGVRCDTRPPRRPPVRSTAAGGTAGRPT